MKSAIRGFSTLVAVIAFVLMIVLGIHAFIAYPNSFFTTSEDFVQLGDAAPMLYKVIIGCTVTSFIATAIAYLTRKK